LGKKRRRSAPSLLVSPIVGFCAAALLLMLCKALIKAPELYKSPEGKGAAAVDPLDSSF